MYDKIVSQQFPPPVSMQMGIIRISARGIGTILGGSTHIVKEIPPLFSKVPQQGGESPSGGNLHAQKPKRFPPLFSKVPQQGGESL